MIGIGRSSCLRIRAVAVSATAAVIAAALLGCAGRTPFEGSNKPYSPSRFDYEAFRKSLGERGEDLLEPNYLPFMAHRFRSHGEDDEDLLVLCRWPDAAMPLGVYAATPNIPDRLQNEFYPQPAESYEQGVFEALAMWERELEGLVRFRRVESPDEAALEIQLLPEVAPAQHDKKILGTIRLHDACRPKAWVDRDSDAPGSASQLKIEFAVPPLRIYLADEFGLLTPNQVKWIALHEIGHALGMREHSPIPADLMYEVVRESVFVPGLSVEDVNSFVSLYQLPNGTVFDRERKADDAGEGEEEASDSVSSRNTRPPDPGLELSVAPYVNSRLGFEFNPPRDWLRIETSRGMVAIDGLTWDSSASFQVIVEPYDSIEEYLERFSTFFLSHGRLRFYGQIDDIEGYPTMQAIIEKRGDGMLEEITLIEVGDGRLIVTIADCRIEYAETYLAWFRATRASLDIWVEGNSR